MRGLMPGIEFMKEEERRLRRLRRLAVYRLATLCAWTAFITLLIVYACTR